MDAFMKVKVEEKETRVKYVMALSLDISGLFDSVWLAEILKVLKERNCQMNVLVRGGSIGQLVDRGNTAIEISSPFPVSFHKPMVLTPQHQRRTPLNCIVNRLG
ncbi:hypothetical protein J6590_030151 [Homalodisca vitripennis]|nr:hypothetical protein J6590_030151 [Homalodisca vitripennis]